MSSELAYDANGHPIRLSPDVAKYLVRQHRAKAPPKVMFRNGRRMTLPVAAGIDDSRTLVNDAPGRYRLLPLDQFDSPVEGVPEAYVEIDPEPAQAFAAPAQASGADAARMALAQDPRDLLLLETMRANTELARAMIDRLPDIMKASAFLLQAADGAGLPRRPPLWLDEDDDDDDDDADEYDDATVEPRTPSVLETICQAALGGGNLSGLAKLLGGGAGATAPAPAPAPAPPAPGATPSPSRTAHTPPPAPFSSAPAPATARNAAPPVDAQAHLIAILSQLTAEEQAYAERVISALDPAAIKEWHDMLLAMSVDDAVTLIRTKAQGKET